MKPPWRTPTCSCRRCSLDRSSPREQGASNPRGCRHSSAQVRQCFLLLCKCIAFDSMVTECRGVVSSLVCGAAGGRRSLLGEYACVLAVLSLRCCRCAIRCQRAFASCASLHIFTRYCAPAIAHRVSRRVIPPVNTDLPALPTPHTSPAFQLADVVSFATFKVCTHVCTCCASYNASTKGPRARREYVLDTFLLLYGVTFLCLGSTVYVLQ